MASVSPERRDQFSAGNTDRICEGKGKSEDLDLLESMSSTIQRAALCALGRTAPNPVLSTLKYFRDEYLEHINNHRCPAGICKGTD